MPLVMVRYKSSTLESTKDLLQLSNRLPVIVAAALNTGEGENCLKPEDVDVEFSEAHVFDQNECRVAITIFANAFLERVENLDERKDQILANIRSMRTNEQLDASVYILLGQGAFGRV